MYDNIIYYCVIMCLLVPVASEDAKTVLLWLICIILLTATVMYNSPLSLYLCAIVGECFNILAYTRLGSDSRVVALTTLSIWAILLNILVWIDPYSNLLYLHYEQINTALLELSIIILTLKIGTDSPLRKLFNKR